MSKLRYAVRNILLLPPALLLMVCYYTIEVIDYLFMED